MWYWFVETGWLYAMLVMGIVLTVQLIVKWKDWDSDRFDRYTERDECDMIEYFDESHTNRSYDKKQDRKEKSLCISCWQSFRSPTTECAAGGFMTTITTAPAK